MSRERDLQSDVDTGEAERAGGDIDGASKSGGEGTTGGDPKGHGHHGGLAIGRTTGMGAGIEKGGTPSPEESEQ